MNKGVSEIGFLFDLDGVIIDSEQEYSKIWSQINFEFPSGVKDLEKVIKGCTLSKILSDYYPDSSIREKVSKRLHELEAQMVYNYLPYSKEFLQQLKDKNFPCALVTSSDNQKMSHLNDELPGLLDFFKVVITGDLVKTSKPSPEGYLLAASKLNVAPRYCFVFEDSKQGVMAGNNSGAFVVGVEGTFPPETLKPFTDLMIRNFSEIDLDTLILQVPKP